MSDTGLNNTLAQYFGGAAPTTKMLPSVVLASAAPSSVYKDTVEGMVSTLHGSGSLPGSDLTTTLYCFMLPKGAVLYDGASPGSGAPAAKAIELDPEDADSLNGLGGYHGSIHAGPDTIYYATGVYSEGNNGIVAFDMPWKNVVATFYHELNEARTDSDVEDAADASSMSVGQKLLGWYSVHSGGGEIGDIPMNEAGANLGKVMVEVPLTSGTGSVPVQLMWSNATGAPQGPVPSPLPGS
jgi:hypothetical protein